VQPDKPGDDGFGDSSAVFHEEASYTGPDLAPYDAAGFIGDDPHAGGSDSRDAVIFREHVAGVVLEFRPDHVQTGQANVIALEGEVGSIALTRWLRGASLALLVEPILDLEVAREAEPLFV